MPTDLPSGWRGKPSRSDSLADFLLRHRSMFWPLWFVLTVLTTFGLAAAVSAW